MFQFSTLGVSAAYAVTGSRDTHSTRANSRPIKPVVSFFIMKNPSFHLVCYAPLLMVHIK